MGGNKRHLNHYRMSEQTEKDQQEKCSVVGEQSEDENKFVNLLHVYTIYKQKLRRICKEEFEQILCQRNIGKKVTTELCKELMKAKDVPEVDSYIENVGFLTVPRLMPLIALLADRAGYKLISYQARGVDFSIAPKRFREKFSHLLSYGFWFLGRVISDSLSEKAQVNRGNKFNFTKGDMGYWWAGVKILDWNVHVHIDKEPLSCHTFVIRDLPKHREYSSRALKNMHQHPMYFLSELDWVNFSTTIKSIRQKKISNINVEAIMIDALTRFPSICSPGSKISFRNGMSDSEASIDTASELEWCDSEASIDTASELEW